MLPPNRCDVCDRQFRAPIRFADVPRSLRRGEVTSADGIPNVLFLCARVEMIWATTTSDIAAMEDRQRSARKPAVMQRIGIAVRDRKSTRLNSSHLGIS